MEAITEYRERLQKQLLAIDKKTDLIKKYSADQLDTTSKIQEVEKRIQEAEDLTGTSHNDQVAKRSIPQLKKDRASYKQMLDRTTEALKV